MASSTYSKILVTKVFERIFLQDVHPPLWKMNCIAVSPNGRLLFIAARSRIYVYQLNPVLGFLLSLTPFKILEQTDSEVNQIRTGYCGPDAVLISVDMEALVTVYFCDDLLRNPVTFSNNINPAEDNSTWSCAVSETSPLIAVGSNSHILTTWNLRTGSKVVLSGHQHNVPAVDITPCGRFIASASIDKSLRVWDTETGETIRRCLPSLNWGWGVRCVSLSSVKRVPNEESILQCVSPQEHRVSAFDYVYRMMQRHREAQDEEDEGDQMQDDEEEAELELEQEEDEEEEEQEEAEEEEEEEQADEHVGGQGRPPSQMVALEEQEPVGMTIDNPSEQNETDGQEDERADMIGMPGQPTGQEAYEDHDEGHIDDIDPADVLYFDADSGELVVVTGEDGSDSESDVSEDDIVAITSDTRLTRPPQNIREHMSTTVSAAATAPSTVVEEIPSPSSLPQRNAPPFSAFASLATQTVPAAQTESAAASAKFIAERESQLSQYMFLYSTQFELFAVSSEMEVLDSLSSDWLKPIESAPNMLRGLHRISLLEYIPELSCVLAASQCGGQVTVSRLLRVGTEALRCRFNPEAFIPPQPTRMPIVGMTVVTFRSPVPALEFSRLYTVSMDKTISCYELRRQTEQTWDLNSQLI